MDAKDILGLPKHALPIQEKKSKPPKESQRKPEGISREVYALTGGLAPLMPAIDVNQLKRKAQAQNEKITWQWLPFTNSARKDSLQLYHWVRVVNGIPPTGDYSFAKYNKSVDVIKYTDEEYEKYLTDPAWTKEETDQLFDLCERFDLRFIVIADRLPSSKTVEELKDRYYSVSRTILSARAASPGEVANHPIVKEPYNASQETERKRALSLLLSHTKQQERKDVEVLAQAKRITEARKTIKASQQPEVPVISDVEALGVDKDIISAETVPPSTSSQFPSTITSPVSETASVMASLRMLRVYLRTYALEQMVQAASSSAGLRTIKRVEQTLQDLGVNLKPKVPTKAVCAEHLELRKEILTLLNLQKQLQNKEAEGSSFRDGSYTETPGTPPKQQALRAADLDRTFTPDSISIGGERFGKREQKRKGGPGRLSEAPSSPAQSKRPRKYKASD
ncbi:DNA methyltransferase 1-associated protein-1 [Handroanthus impetiginosus]|uniref:DNA methyltransferase 1-associated protein-1 n=1 Tax=Handroanthus impetiginosus TaxID=429701 RepID=A0A2G9HDE9_9LAMI|nr:DNA methyltransferase 1-associated protein-1 [Handroanthus impetiginosus]